jgi:hypothetical protein
MNGAASGRTSLAVAQHQALRIDDIITGEGRRIRLDQIAQDGCVARFDGHDFACDQQKCRALQQLSGSVISGNAEVFKVLAVVSTLSRLPKLIALKLG